ncbi:MAG: TolC family protein [Vicinamibacterales bacterium]
MIALLVLALQTAGAPAPAPGPSPAPLTLGEAVTRARDTSPLRQAAAVLAEGTARAARLAGRLLNPLMDVRIENLGAGAEVLGVPPDVFTVATQSLEWPGKRTVRRAVAEAEGVVATETLASLERQLALEAVRIYMRAFRAREVLTSLSATRTGLATLVDTMARRVTEGVSAESDLLRFQTEAARLDAEVARTRVDLARALAELAALLGVPDVDAARLAAPPNWASLRVERPTALEPLVEARPEVRVADARRLRAEHAAALERLRAKPEPAVTGGYKRTAGVNTAVLGVTVAVPLFDRNGQAIARAEADAKAAARDVDVVRSRLLADIRAQLEAAATLAEQASRVERDLLTPAEGVRNAARATFREGATDVLKLVDAERVYADVRREALAVRIDAYVAGIEARFALGQEDIP